MIETNKYENDEDYLEALELLDDEYPAGRVTRYKIILRSNIEYSSFAESGSLIKNG
jgi:hypothetical protein